MANEIRQWIEIDPLDTLFFRGSDPMVAGESHEVRTVFPPMPSTIMGALRTAILAQRGVDLNAFLRHGGGSDLPHLGSAGKPGFAVVGPLIEATLGDGKGETFFPTPAHWFGEKDESKDTIGVCVAKHGLSEASDLGLTGGGPAPLLVEAPRTTSMKSLHGYWANAVTFDRVAKGKRLLPIIDTLGEACAGASALLRPDTLFGQEQRTGLALDIGARRAVKGHLYTATHVRLADGVRLLIGLSDDLVPTHIDAEGVMQLGGEQRLVRYRLRQKKVTLPASTTGWAMALAPATFASLRQAGLGDTPRASGALLRMAGWDMKINFHKPSMAYLPMGSVIKIEDASTAIPFGFIAI
jgi:CRISPR-associated protein Cmr3